MELIFKPAIKLTDADIENACNLLLLQLTMKGSLTSLPENTHWHYKMTRNKGVLEITLLLNENKLILSCKKNRMGKWVDEVANELKSRLKLIEIKQAK